MIFTKSNSMNMIRQLLKHLSGLLFSLLLIFILLITSFEAVCYWTPNYFQAEYEKYDVLSHINGDMSMDAALEVTEQMMAYLRGKRQNLIVETSIDGRTQEFFNAREKAHMADVRALFVGAVTLRALAILACIALAGVLIVLTDEALNILARGFIHACIAVFACTLGISVLAATDFTRYFTLFHELFFSNDLWLLDPRTDNLINLLPEGFFSDTALRIVLYFGVSLTVLLAAALWITHKAAKRKRLSANTPAKRRAALPK